MNVAADWRDPLGWARPYCAHMAHAWGILRGLTGRGLAGTKRRGAPEDDRFREQVVEGMMRSLSPRLRQDEAERAGRAPAGPAREARGADRRG